MDDLVIDARLDDRGMMPCGWPGCQDAVHPVTLLERLTAKLGHELAVEGAMFCRAHRAKALELIRHHRSVTSTLISFWPTCAWCGRHLDERRLIEIADEFDVSTADHVRYYCSAHRRIEGSDPTVLAKAGIRGAEALFDLPEERLVRFPQRELNTMVGPMVPGRVYYVGAFPGGGKTTAVTNWIWHWVRVKKLRVRYLPLEADLDEVYARFACFMAGVSPDDALSFRLRDAERAGDLQAAIKREELKLAQRYLMADAEFARLLQVDPIETLTPRTFAKALETTRELESDIVVVDHVDHTEADADDWSPEIQISNKVQHMALRAAKALRIPFLLTTQFNSSRSGNDVLVRMKPPSPDWMFNKAKKEMIGAGIIGLHRVIDPRADQNLLRRVRNREAEAWKVALPNIMGATDMKLRFGRGTLNATVHLALHHGVITDLPRDPFEAYAHEVETAKRAAQPGPMRPDSTVWMDN